MRERIWFFRVTSEFVFHEERDIPVREVSHLHLEFYQRDVTGGMRSPWTLPVFVVSRSLLVVVKLALSFVRHWRSVARGVGLQCERNPLNSEFYLRMSQANAVTLDTSCFCCLKEFFWMSLSCAEIRKHSAAVVVWVSRQLGRCECRCGWSVRVVSAFASEHWRSVARWECHCSSEGARFASRILPARCRCWSPGHSGSFLWRGLEEFWRGDHSRERRWEHSALNPDVQIQRGSSRASCTCRRESLLRLRCVWQVFRRLRPSREVSSRRLRCVWQVCRSLRPSREVFLRWMRGVWQECRCLRPSRGVFAEEAVVGGVLAEAERCLAGVPTSEAATKSSFSKYHEVVAVAHKRDGFEQAQRSLAAVSVWVWQPCWRLREGDCPCVVETAVFSMSTSRSWWRSCKAGYFTTEKKWSISVWRSGRLQYRRQKIWFGAPSKKNEKTLIIENIYVIVETFRFEMIATNDFMTLTKFLRYYLICNPAADREWNDGLTREAKKSDEDNFPSGLNPVKRWSRPRDEEVVFKSLLFYLSRVSKDRQKTSRRQSHVRGQICPILLEKIAWLNVRYMSSTSLIWEDYVRIVIKKVDPLQLHEYIEARNSFWCRGKNCNPTVLRSRSQCDHNVVDLSRIRPWFQFRILSDDANLSFHLDDNSQKSRPILLE